MTRRPGVSLTELMIALSLFSILLATSLGFYKQQGDAFTQGNDRMTLMQNLRYGIDALEQNLRTAGVGVPIKQPVMVYVGEYAVTFNADYATRTPGDFFAVYHDPLLPEAGVSAPPPSRKFTIPGTAFAYPDSAYFSGSTNSPAETITFFFALDTSTSRADDYVLYRQVNDLDPEIISTHLLRTAAPFFTYYVHWPEGDTQSIVKLDGSYLPAAHTEAIHGSPGDTGIVAGVDSVRAVRVTYAATNGYDGDREITRQITRLIRLPNTGMAASRSCGNRPFLNTSLLATGVAPTESTGGHIRLGWAQATDEYTGEQDVLRYVIWRRPAGTIAWGDPLISIPPGSSTYVHRDFSAAGGQQYDYALAAQDCTPQYSDLTTAEGVSWAAQ